MREAVVPWVVGLLCAGCMDEAAVWLDAEDFRTVLVIRGPFESGTLLVREAAEDVIRLEVEPEEELTLLRFRQTLAGLRLEPGQFKLSKTGRRVPAPDEVLAWRGDRLSVLEASEIDLGTLRLPWLGGDPCLEIRLRASVELPELSSGVLTVLPLWPDRALLVGVTGVFYELSVAGELRVLEALAGQPSDAAYFDASSNEVWLASRRGPVVRGHPDRGFEAINTRTSTVPLFPPLRIDGARGGAPSELFVLSGMGGLEHYDGQAWSTLAEENTWGASGVIWTGLNEAIASDLEPETVTHYASGRLEQRAIPLAPGDIIKSLQVVEGYGPVVGTSSGKLHHFAGETWTALPTGPVATRVFGALAREQGIVYGGERGLLIQFVEEHGFCEGVRLTPFDLNTLTWVGDHIVGCGGADIGTNSSCGIFSIH